MVDGTLASWLGPVAALAVWFAITLATGRSVGDLATGVRYPPGSLPGGIVAAVRWLAGVGGYGLLLLLPSPWTWLAWLFAALAVGATLISAGGRGLPGLVLRRSPVSATAAPLAGWGPAHRPT